MEQLIGGVIWHVTALPVKEWDEKLDRHFSKIRYVKLVRRYLWMSFRSRIEYKVSFYFEIIFQVVMLVISLMFWQVIFLNTTQFGN